MKIWYF